MCPCWTGEEIQSAKTGARSKKEEELLPLLPQTRAARLNLSLTLPFNSSLFSKSNHPFRILVEKLAAPTKTVGGVLLPESATAGKVRCVT